MDSPKEKKVINAIFIDPNNGLGDFGYTSNLLEYDERDSLGRALLRHVYLPRPGSPQALADVNKDTLIEVVFVANGLYSNFEQPTVTELPTRLNFTHRNFQGNAGAGFTGIYIGSLDGDSLTDFLYVGSEPDSSDTTRGG